MKRFAFYALVVGALLVAAPASQATKQRANGKASLVVVEPGAQVTVDDNPLADFRGQLLDAAFKTASAFPIRPHIKNRSRAQEKVVEACLELDQPRRALRYIKKIKNWRRGKAYAQVARYLVEERQFTDVDNLLNHAQRIANAPGLKIWRQNRIRMQIAKTRYLLGQNNKGAEMAAAAKEAELQDTRGAADNQDPKGQQQQVAAQAQTAKVMASDAEAFEGQIKKLDAFVDTQDYGTIEYTLQAYVRLYDQHYQNKKRRSRIEKKIRDAQQGFPIFFKLSVHKRLIEVALTHADNQNAQKLIDEAQKIVDDATWDPNKLVAREAELAQLRARADDPQGAREQANAAMSLFEKKKDQIQSYKRAAALRPVAEAYALVGDSSTALKTYRLTVEQGAINPNIRPRTEDLSETCASMAVHAIEPDAQLWNRMTQIREGLESR
jgi:hypothetical protein